VKNENLTDAEKHVIFEGGTEPAFSGELLHEDRKGNFTCKNCGQVLFTSDTKFDSGSGWPSFTEPANLEHVTLLEDSRLWMKRVEVRCKNCNAHLGHVFDDGPADKGGQRYCINSLSLGFDPDKSDTAS
jgi:peptide-methionine (R)-S-oxide reductase